MSKSNYTEEIQRMPANKKIIVGLSITSVVKTERNRPAESNQRLAAGRAMVANVCDRLGTSRSNTYVFTEQI